MWSLNDLDGNANERDMLKYVNTGIVFQEIPDEVTLAVNLSGCPCHCPGCHSAYLWQDIGTPLTTAELEKIMREKGRGITCVCFMGGDAEPAGVNALARYLRQKHPDIKVGWYSGRQHVPATVDKADFDYLKLGPYIAHLGCLRERTTNQRLFKRIQDTDFIDITARFWK